MNKPIKEMLEVISDELKRVRVVLAKGSVDIDKVTESALDTLEQSVQTLETFFRTVRSMRDAQQCFDTTGAGKYLGDKMRLEKLVDELLAEFVAKSDEVPELIPEGTDVYLELGSGSKSEFVDATIIGHCEGKYRVQASWGAVFNLVDPNRVQRREVAHA